MEFGFSSARMFVTGISGLLGANFAYQARMRHEVFGIYHQNAVFIPGVHTERLDLQSEDDVFKRLNEIRPSIIVHLAALTDVDYCERHASETEIMNVVAARRLARWAASNNCLFVLMSTDSVFDGGSSCYKENDPVRPANCYAKSKLAAEVAIRELGAAHFIVRASIYGSNSQKKRSLSEWILGRLQAGQAVPAFTDVRFSPLLVTSLASLILEMIDKGASGTYHLASSDCVSKYEFARIIADEWELSKGLIERTSVKSAGLIARRPLNTCLSTAKARSELALEFPSVREDIARLKDLHEDGYDALLKSFSTSATE